jgi:cytochrome c oxidase cbb3-type subunit 3
MKMNKLLIVATLTFSTTQVLAQAAEPVQPSIWDGPNLALAIVAVVQLIAILAVAGILKRITANSEFFVKIFKLRDSQKLKNLALLIGFAGLSTLAHAQERAEIPEYPAFFKDPNTVMLLMLNVLLLGMFIYMTRMLRKTIGMLMPELEQKTETAKAAEKSEESSFMHVLTDAVPVEREHEVMTDHEYDGIRELDNNLPPWWVWMFYVTIIFAFVYLIYYHVLPYGMSQEEQYVAEVEQAEADRQAFLAQAKNLVDENTVEFLADASDLNKGKAIFTELCQQCHAADGGGGVGPNLTDQYWIHGGSIQDIFKTVKYGVPTKGMISWESQLRPVQMAQVSSYIQTLQGTTPANPKEPQGELYSPEEAPADTTNTESPEMEEMESEGDSDEATAALQ